MSCPSITSCLYACLRCERRYCSDVRRDLIPDFSACVKKNITSNHNCLCKAGPRTRACEAVGVFVQVRFHGQIVGVVKEGSAAVSPWGSDQLTMLFKRYNVSFAC